MVKKPWPSWHDGRVGDRDRICCGDTVHHHADAGSFTCARFPQRTEVVWGVHTVCASVSASEKTEKGGQDTQTNSTRTLIKLVG